MELQTRQDFAALLRRMLDPLKPLYSPQKALLQLGDTGVSYPPRTIGMEGFSRPLWGLAPYWMGGCVDEDFAAIYRKGLAAGSDPQNSEYWGDPGDYDQCFVEMAAIGCALLEVPQIVWDPLTGEQKKNLARWLDTINHHELPHCNWLFFRVLVNLGLDAVGMPGDVERGYHGLGEGDR